jgi:hypothetical protein
MAWRRFRLTIRSQEIATAAGWRNQQSRQQPQVRSSSDLRPALPASQADQRLNRAGWPETRHQGSRRRHLARQLHATQILDTSTWSRKPCNPSTTRAARSCHPCLRYDLLPMSPGWTEITLERVTGIEPSYSAWKSGNLAVFSASVLTLSVFFGPLRLFRNFSLSE